MKTKLYYATYLEKGGTYSEHVTSLTIKQAREELKKRRPALERIIHIRLCTNKNNHL